MLRPETVLAFWLDEIGPKGWYVIDDALDADIRSRFGESWDAAMNGACGLWLTSAAGALAYIILTDQFSRNMFRGTGKAFMSDRNARAASKIAIDRDWDMEIAEPARQFFYLPLMHSENLIDQDRAVRLIHTRMPEGSGGTLNHARAHRKIIRKFGRFPFRNTALERPSTKAETVFMEEGGYGNTYRTLISQTADS